MEDTEEVGESVLYTGDISYAEDEYTKILMERHLFPHNWYEVSVVESCTNRVGYYYGFIDDSIMSCYIYPSKSFIRKKDINEYYKNRYGLK